MSISKLWEKFKWPNNGIPKDQRGGRKNIFRSHVQKSSKCDENCKPIDPRN